MPPNRRLLLTVLLAAASALALACRPPEPAPGSDYRAAERPTAGPPRAYQLGFSATPSDLTNKAYVAAFNLATEFGEALLLQRPPAWQSFLPNAKVADVVRDQTLSDREAARARGLSLFVVLDVFDPASRDRLNGLPAEYRGRQLDDRDLRQALVADALFVARNQQPEFLAIGNEINATFERNPAAYAQFLTAYAEVYDAVKKASPSTKVFTTFQYEELLGVIPWEPPHAPRWELIGQFTERLDLFAITTYPSFAFQVARKVPPLYYRQIREQTALPIAFAAVGYSSTQGRDGVNSSTPPEQRRFVQRLFEDADWLGVELLIWFAGRDLNFAIGPPHDLIAGIGLRDGQDQPKEAWPLWVEASRRPLDRLIAERNRQAALAGGGAATPTPRPAPGR
ncbi:MAG: hypothetical protein FJZ92_06175 [Chloroflexi bacterium]|nr:hypothetical protein [Chloroflexota bacterium]